MGPGANVKSCKRHMTNWESELNKHWEKLTRYLGIAEGETERIIESHNGQIIVESQEDLGTTFTILLPVEQS